MKVPVDEAIRRVIESAKLRLGRKPTLKELSRWAKDYQAVAEGLEKYVAAATVKKMKSKRKKS